MKTEQMTEKQIDETIANLEQVRQQGNLTPELARRLIKLQEAKNLIGRTWRRW